MEIQVREQHSILTKITYPSNTCITALEIHVLEKHYYSNTIEVEPYGEQWYLDIKYFLADKKYPQHANGS